MPLWVIVTLCVGLPLWLAWVIDIERRDAYFRHVESREELAIHSVFGLVIRVYRWSSRDSIWVTKDGRCFMTNSDAILRVNAAPKRNRRSLKNVASRAWEQKEDAK